MNQKIIIPDTSKLETKLRIFKENGKQRLQVVSDFDRTLTKCFYNGENQSSFNILNRYLPKKKSKKLKDLFNIYYPIEHNPSLPKKEKDRLMTEWWEAHMDILISCKITKDLIRDIINNGDVLLRDQADQFLHILQKQDIPLLILSAGVGDIIVEHLAVNNLQSKNTYTSSNFFVFNDSGTATHFNRVFHTYNKRQKFFENEDYKQSIQERKHVLLLGDTLGDPLMVAEKKYNCVLKIGFLNHNERQLKRSFEELYDVIILNDGTMEYPLQVLRKLI